MHILASFGGMLSCTLRVLVIRDSETQQKKSLLMVQHSKWKNITHQEALLPGSHSVIRTSLPDLREASTLALPLAATQRLHRGLELADTNEDNLRRPRELPRSIAGIPTASGQSPRRASHRTWALGCPGGC